MVCRVHRMGNVTAIVCGPRRRQKPCSCGAPGTLLCDWKIGDGKTCDRPICGDCASEVGPDKHLCPPHQVAYRNHLDRRADTA